MLQWTVDVLVGDNIKQ